MHLADDIFSGCLVRSLLKRGTSFSEYFELAPEDAEFGDGAYLSRHGATKTVGPLILDFCRFEVNRMGPAVIYTRPLPVKTNDELNDYFSGNLKVLDLEQFDSGSSRAPDQLAGSDEEMMAKFRSDNPDHLTSYVWPEGNRVWDIAVARGTKWMTGRIAGWTEQGAREYLTWAGFPWRTLSSEIIRSFLDAIPEKIETERAGNWRVELQVLNMYRPSEIGAIFQIERKSRLSKEAYVSAFGRPERGEIAPI